MCCWEAAKSAMQGPAVPMVRRHLNGSAARFGPQVPTVSGNYVAAKRKGVVNGVDLGYTGMVSAGDALTSTFQYAK
jgi:acetylglutamate kinase